MVAALVIIVTSVPASSSSSSSISVDMSTAGSDVAWRAWKDAFRPHEYPDAEAEISAYRAFVANSAAIARHNARKDSTYTLGHTQFSDLTPEQFAKRMRSRATAIHSPSFVGKIVDVDSLTLPGTTLPESVDWTKEGKVGCALKSSMSARVVYSCCKYLQEVATLWVQCDCALVFFPMQNCSC